MSATADSKTGKSKTLIIIPAYNEADALPAVLAELAHRADAFDVVVVSDGSTDATAEVARAAGVIVLELPYNLGIGGALRTGFRFAVAARYPRAVQFDADGQHDPNELGLLVEPLGRGVDLVVGSRFASSGQADYRVGRARRAAMHTLNTLVRWMTRHSFTDSSSGFRAFSAPMLEYFAHRYPLEYMDSVEALVMACSAGYRVEEVAVRMRARQGGVASTRHVRLLYSYVRLLIALIARLHRRRPSHQQGA